MFNTRNIPMANISVSVVYSYTTLQLGGQDTDKDKNSFTKARYIRKGLQTLIHLIYYQEDYKQPPLSLPHAIYLS
jgi:hypothetical protein